jgi:hypothetical protein
MDWRSWALGLFFLIGGVFLTLVMSVVVVASAMDGDWEGVSETVFGLFIGVGSLWIGVKWWREMRS